MMCCENTSPETCKLHYCVIEFDKPIKMDTFIGTEEEMNVPINTSQKLEVSDTKIFKEAVEADPLTVLSQENCRLLWKYRYLVEKTKPGSLARLVSA
ncbi:phosphatidylinositol 3-kinase 1, putative, partial [Entamoeba nuttalli P19]